MDNQTFDKSKYIIFSSLISKEEVRGCRSDERKLEELINKAVEAIKKEIEKEVNSL